MNNDNGLVYEECLVDWKGEGIYVKEKVTVGVIGESFTWKHITTIESVTHNLINKRRLVYLFEYMVEDLGD